MKHIFLITVVSLSFFNCKKEVSLVTTTDYLANVKRNLVDSMSSADFHTLDFGRAVISSVDSINMYVARIPFKTKLFDEDFVAVKTDREGNILRGRIVHIELTQPTNSNPNLGSEVINGVFLLHSLQGKRELTSPIINGRISAFHQQAMQKTSVEMVPDVLPEVIIVGVRHLNAGMSFSTWCMVQSFFMDYGEGGGGSWGGYYGSLYPSDPWGGGGGGGSIGSGNTSGGGSSSNEIILIDRENQDENPAIDIGKYVTCFNSIPDPGSTCSIEIFSDIPVDGKPNTLFDIDAKSPGHTFISVTKSNGSQHVTQNIGFYPKSGYKATTYAPVASKLVDNSGHEFNASFSMNLTPAQLATVLVKMQQFKYASYDVDEYNCTDFALDVFNSVRTVPLSIPLYGIPGSPLTQATRTPGGLYNKLQEMVNSNDPEKSKITIGIIKGYAGGSTGPCN